MTNRILQNLAEAIHQDLKIMPRGSCFIIEESKRESKIKKIELTFSNKDEVLILKQDKTDSLKKNYTVENLFQDNNPNTNCCCDFIVFLNSNQQLTIFYCEIKTSGSQEYFKEAIRQNNSSRLFVSYLLQYYKDRYSNSDFSQQTPYKYLCIYSQPKINIANKQPTYQKSKNSPKPFKYEGETLYLKEVQTDKKGYAKISDGYSFFNNL